MHPSSSRVKMNVAGAIFLSLAFLVTSTETRKEKKVTVTVYYQTLCPSCERFITEQLYPTFLAVNSERWPKYMFVRLVPYGNAHHQQLRNGTWEIDCKPNNTACAYNKVHACALSVADTEWKSLNFIHCMLSMPMVSPYVSAPSCAIRTCFDDSAMAACVNSVDGDELLVSHGRNTLALNVSLTSLPIVTFDSKYDETEQRRATTNLLSIVCDKIGRTVDACNAPRSRKVMDHENFGTKMYYPERIKCEYL